MKGQKPVFICVDGEFGKNSGVNDRCRGLNDYMISKNTLSHDNFQSRAEKIAEETNAISVSENVARYYVSAEKTLEGWLNSSSHKEALEGNFSHTTLSVQLDKQGRPYYTQIFIKVK